MTARLVSIQVGHPRRVEGDQPWVTAFFKSPVVGPVQLDVPNLQGDSQADLEVHGGPDKAVCVYSTDHVAAWCSELGLARCEPGAFGENFSVAGQTETAVCIGDVYEVGTAVVQVSQPRGPCWKLGRRWNRPDFPRLVLSTGRTGWYLRVVGPGSVCAGDSLQLVDRPYPEWTIQRANDVAYAPADERDAMAVRALAACPALSVAWREWLAG